MEYQPIHAPRLDHGHARASSSIRVSKPEKFAFQMYVILLSSNSEISKKKKNRSHVISGCFRSHNFE
jgi:hypothetical protein